VGRLKHRHRGRKGILLGLTFRIGDCNGVGCCSCAPHDLFPRKRVPAECQCDEHEEEEDRSQDYQFDGEAAAFSSGRPEPPSSEPTNP